MSKKSPIQERKLSLTSFDSNEKKIIKGQDVDVKLILGKDKVIMYVPLSSLLKLGLIDEMREDIDRMLAEEGEVVIHLFTRDNVNDESSTTVRLDPDLNLIFGITSAQYNYEPIILPHTDNNNYYHIGGNVLYDVDNKDFYGSIFGYLQRSYRSADDLIRLINVIYYLGLPEIGDSYVLGVKDIRTLLLPTYYNLGGQYITKSKDSALLIKFFEPRLYELYYMMNSDKVLVIDVDPETKVETRRFIDSKDLPDKGYYVFRSDRTGITVASNSTTPIYKLFNDLFVAKSLADIYDRDHSFIIDYMYNRDTSFIIDYMYNIRTDLNPNDRNIDVVPFDEEMALYNPPEQSEVYNRYNTAALDAKYEKLADISDSLRKKRYQ